MRRKCRWLDLAEMMIPPMPWDRPRWRNRGGPPVVLLHGLWRGLHAMEPLARVLENEGFSPLNLPYPSTRLPIQRLVEYIRGEVNKLATDEPIHFVTHSLGGILGRALLAEPHSWKAGRMVMLAPPNRGSEIVDWSVRHPLIHRLLGPAGRELGGDGFPRQLPDPAEGSEIAVIMGNRCSIPLFAHLLEDDNDGIVSASKGRIPGLRGFAVVDADHTFIQMHPEVIRLCVRFLKSAEWQPSSEAG